LEEIAASNPTNATAYDPAITLWSGRRARSEELKSLYKEKWTQYWQYYRNYVSPLTDPADWWRSNEQIPTVFKIIETLLPRYVTGMFDSPDWFTVEGRSPKGEEYENKCFNLIKTIVEEMDVFETMTEALRYASIMGHAWGKVTWKEETIKVQRFTQQQTPSAQLNAMGEPEMETITVREIRDEKVYDAPNFEFRTLDVIFPDPTGRGMWYIEDIDTTLAELMQTQANEGIYDEGVLAALDAKLGPKPMPEGLDTLGTASRGTAGVHSVEYSREPDVTEGISQYIVNPMRDGQGVKLWQCWGYVDPEFRGADGCEWRLVVIADGQYVLRDDPAPTPDMKPPYFPIKSIPIPKILYGESIINYIGPLADKQSRIANMRSDEISQNIWQTFVVKAGLLPADTQLINMPGAVVQANLDPNQDIKDVFAPIVRHPVFTEAWTEDQYYQTQAEHCAAATDMTQGVSSQSGRTATESQLLVQQGNARHLLQVMWNDTTVKKELLERVWGWLQMRLTTPKLIKMVGEPIDLTQIQEPIDINVNGGMFALTKQARLQMDQELVQLLNIPQFAQVAKPEAIFNQLLMDRGWKKPERFIKTPEEIANEKARAEIAAIMGQDMDAGGGGLPGGDHVPNMPPQGPEASLGGQTLGPPPPGPLTAG